LFLAAARFSAAHHQIAAMSKKEEEQKNDVEDQQPPQRIEDDVLAEQKRESILSTFLSEKRADLQKLREFSTDFRGLRDIHSARPFRLSASNESIGKFSADLGLFFDTLVLVGVLCLILSCLTLHETIVNVEKSKLSGAYDLQVALTTTTTTTTTTTSSFSTFKCLKSYYSNVANFVLRTTPGSKCEDAKARSFYNCPTTCKFTAKDEAEYESVVTGTTTESAVCDMILPCRFVDENVTDGSSSMMCCEESASPELDTKPSLNVGIFIIEILVVLACTIFDAVYQKLQSEKFLKYDAETMTVGDYSVLVRFLDKDATREEVGNFFTHYGEVANTVLMKNVFKLVECERELCRLRLRRAEMAAQINAGNDPQKRRAKKKSVFGKFLYGMFILQGKQATEKNLAALDERIERMKEKIRKIEKTKVLEENTGQAIVTFNYEVSASACVADHISDAEEWFVRKLRKEPDAPKFRGTTAIVVERAPEPSDIIWGNMGFNSRSGDEDNNHNRLFRNRHVHAFFIMSGSLVAFCVAQWYAERWRTKIRLDILKKTALNGGEVSISDADQNVLQVLKITSALTISLINVILTQIAKGINHYERYKSHSMANTMLLGKLVLVHALNVCAIPILVTPCGKSDGDCEWYTSGGLVDQAFYLQLFNIFTPHIMVLGHFIFSPGYFVRKFLAPFAKTQATMDYLYSPPDFPLAEMYAQCCKTFAMANLYGQALPVGYLLAVAALFTQYWANKYTTLRVSRKPPRLMMSSTYMVSSVIKLTTLANILFGYYVFYRTNTDSTLGTARLWTLLAIWIAEAVMPTRFTLGIGKYAERYSKVAKGRKQFEQRGTFGQPYVSLLCMDEDSRMSISSAETKSTASTPPVSPRKHFFQSPLGSFAFSQRQRPSSVERSDEEEKREVETIISEAGVDVEQELMEEVEHISEDSDSEEGGKEKEKEENGGTLEASELEEHEIRRKRPASVSVMEVISPSAATSAEKKFLGKKRRAIAKILLDMERAAMSPQYAPDALAVIPNLSRDDFARYLNFLSCISRCSADTLAHSARLEMYHPPVPNELDETILFDVFVKEYKLFNAMLEANNALLPGQRPWSNPVKTMSAVRALPEIDWKVEMLRRYKESQKRATPSWREFD
jgi:hypothetical protein